jgi:hypothetical protein
MGKIRRRYEVAGSYEDRIYPLFDGRVTLTKIRRLHCGKRQRQYTRAKIEWTVPQGFPHDSPGPRSVSYAIGKSCPRYVLGESDNGLFSGLGVERPRRMASMIGYETFYGLRWKRWGKRRATARGWFSSRTGAPRRVKLTAYARGADPNCSSPNAYGKLRIELAGQQPLVRVVCQ